MIEKKFTFVHLDLFNARIKIKFDESFIIASVLFFVMFERFFIQLGAPNFIIYIIDFANLYLFIKMLKEKVWNRFSFLTLIYIVIILLFSLVAFYNYSRWRGNFFYTLIEIRNIIRFPIFFGACVTFLNKKKCKSIFNWFLIYFYINSIYIVYEYLTFHPENNYARGDWLNGFFGNTLPGGNIFVNAFIIITIIYLLCMWTNGSIPLKKLLCPLVVALIISGLIELKAFFIEVILLYLWYFFTKHKSQKEKRLNILIICLFIITAYISLQYMYKEYPWFREVMSFRGIIKHLSDDTGYTGSKDLNRLTGIFTMAKSVFNGDIADIVMGIGLGNASIVNLNGVNTIFNANYSDLHYSWFSSTYIFAQCGLIGIFLYIIIFIYLLLKKKSSPEFKLLSETTALFAIILFFYNETLKTDAAYFIFFALSCGFIKKNNINNYSERKYLHDS